MQEVPPRLFYAEKIQMLFLNIVFTNGTFNIIIM